eukprot:3123889-Rhodomonas_salina.1
MHGEWFRVWVCVCGMVSSRRRERSPGTVDSDSPPSLSTSRRTCARPSAAQRRPSEPGCILRHKAHSSIDRRGSN